MAQDYTTTGLLDSIRVEGSLPADDPNATDAILLALADRVISRMFVPAICKALADYYVEEYELQLEAATGEYRLPYRATGSTLRAVVYVDSSEREYELTPVPLSQRHQYSLTSQLVPAHYTIRDDMVVLLPTPSSSSGSVRFVYEYAPGKLILPTSASKITAIVDTGTTSTLSGVVYDVYIPTGTGSFAPSSPTACEMQSGWAPFAVYQRESLFDGVVPIVGANLFIPTGERPPIIGDYICPVGETPIPRIPAELHATLALACAGQYLRPTDPDTGKDLLSQAREDLSAQVSLISSRQKGRQQKIRSTTSLLRGRGVYRNTFGNWQP